MRSLRSFPFSPHKPGFAALLLCGCALFLTIACDEEAATEPANRAPEIQSITVIPRNSQPGDTVTVRCVAVDVDGDPMTCRWSADVGTYLDGGEGWQVRWLVPVSFEDAALRCTVSDGALEVTDEIMVYWHLEEGPVAQVRCTWLQMEDPPGVWQGEINIDLVSLGGDSFSGLSAFANSFDVEDLELYLNGGISHYRTTGFELPDHISEGEVILRFGRGELGSRIERPEVVGPIEVLTDTVAHALGQPFRMAWSADSRADYYEVSLFFMAGQPDGGVYYISEKSTEPHIELDGTYFKYPGIIHSLSVEAVCGPGRDEGDEANMDGFGYGYLTSHHFAWQDVDIPVVAARETDSR